LSAVPAISAARKAAFAILTAVERGHDHSDNLLRGQNVNALSPADRNLATALVLGVLRWQIRLDHQIRNLLKRPNAKVDTEVLIALRLGAFQILFLDRIPARAAIDESVELTKQSGHRFASAMVNAVLRSLANGIALRSHFPEESPDELALAHAHPAWLVERWAHFYGIEVARAICSHGQVQPTLTVRFKSPDVEQELTQAGIRLDAGRLLTAARTVASGDLTATQAFRAGRVRVQDEGSQLIGELTAFSGGKATSILDACAAPGGKTLILAERNPEAQIVACESNAQRFAQLSKRMAAVAGRVECRLADATMLGEDSVFDLALADVPCSGTGTLGRNPEIRHRLRPEDIARHAERQIELLRCCLQTVRPGGRVVYSTCSLEPEENEQVVAAVLAQNQNARQLSFEPHIESLCREGVLSASGAERLSTCLTSEGGLRLRPGTLPTDGFFVALIEKSA
jgi:16S rRNA (cytosine967-C5)-methyltransferase